MRKDSTCLLAMPFGLLVEKKAKKTTTKKTPVKTDKVKAQPKKGGALKNSLKDLNGGCPLCNLNKSGGSKVNTKTQSPESKTIKKDMMHSFKTLTDDLRQFLNTY